MAETEGSNRNRLLLLLLLRGPVQEVAPGHEAVQRGVRALVRPHDHLEARSDEVPVPTELQVHRAARPGTTSRQ